MKGNILLKLNNRTPVGVYCACTANELVIEATLEYAKEQGSLAIVEATANQVNQYGGYTGMTPEDYKHFVYSIADKVRFNKECIILGGDHLGPLTWTHLSEDEAMENAKKLVYDYVYAGFTKIHLDTSMRVLDDATDERLSDATIARRSAILAQSCLDAYQERLKVVPDAIFPVFIIGSEVPIPGGAQEKENTLEVTSTKDFITTHEVFEQTFKDYGVEEVFKNVIAIVVQPGVEFGDEDLFLYNHENAKDLTSSLKNQFNSLVFEGHSTDYQNPAGLKEMVEDGIVILKVGPALTFALREALFALSYIENQLCEKPSRFIEVLEEAMMHEPKNWQNHYHGTDKELWLKRKYSYSDRARYYLPVESVRSAMNALFHNLTKTPILMPLLSQYLPYQYRSVKEGKIALLPQDIVKDYIKIYLAEYEYASQSHKLYEL